MKKEFPYQDFARLLESHLVYHNQDLDEARREKPLTVKMRTKDRWGDVTSKDVRISNPTAFSTIGRTLKEVPTAKILMKYLHSQEQVDPNQGWQRVEKISWSDIKGYGSNAWILMVFKTGTAAIHVKDREYIAFAIPDGATDIGEVSKDTFTSSSSALKFIKEELQVRNNPNPIYLSIDTGEGNRRYYGGGRRQAPSINKDAEQVHTARSNRREMKIDKLAQTTPETLFKRFKPLFLRTVDAAIQDVKGWAGQLVNKGNFQTSKVKIEKLQNLEDIRDKLAVGDFGSGGYRSDSPKETLGRKINDAVILAAQNYRLQKNRELEAKGEMPLPISRINNGYHGLGFNDEATGKVTTNEFLKSISDGNLKNLGSVLAYFKRKVMH